MQKVVNLPELGENIESGDVTSILVSVGDHVEAEQALIEVETDKAAIEVPAPFAGVIQEILIEEGAEAKVGAAIVSMEITEGAAASTDAAPSKPQTPKAPAAAVKPAAAPAAQPMMAAGTMPLVSHLIPASPSARRRARELGVDLNTVPRSPFGRVTVAGVEGSAASGFKMPEVPLPDFSKWGEVEREKMSKVRKVTAEHLSATWNSVPQVTHYDKADVTALETKRKALKTMAEKHGHKLTVTAILLKVCADALKEFPQFNASIDMKSQEVIKKSYFNVGVAVDTDRGLLVPVVRDVDQKDIIDLAGDLSEISSKARDKKLSVADMQGGNFTISNLGGIGGIGFSPIVNAPEVAILGVSRGQMEAKLNGEDFEPRLMMPISLSYDHRLIDGADAARFVRYIVEKLEDPENLSW